MKQLIDAVVQRLCKYMGEQSLTQYKLAQQSGLPFSTVKSIMQKRASGVSLKTIILLAKGVGVTPSEFINSKDFMAENLNMD